MKGFTYSLIVILVIISCKKEKSIEDYPLEDFHEVRGVVYESNEIDHLFSESTWDIKYVFKIDDKSYKGEKQGFVIPMIVGQSIILLVNKNNPNISFYKDLVLKY